MVAPRDDNSLKLPRVATRGEGTYSASGVYGQATLATAEKGRAVAQALLQQVLSDIEAMGG